MVKLRKTDLDEKSKAQRKISLKILHFLQIPETPVTEPLCS